jgi:hypothetical protein
VASFEVVSVEPVEIPGSAEEVGLPPPPHALKVSARHATAGERGNRNITKGSTTEIDLATQPRRNVPQDFTDMRLWRRHSAVRTAAGQAIPGYSGVMPIGAHDNLRTLYNRQKLLLDEASRLEEDRERLEKSGADADRRYILELEITALREESSRIGSRISDVLERDLQR